VCRADTCGAKSAISKRYLAKKGLFTPQVLAIFLDFQPTLPVNPRNIAAAQ
jgi:hypothetical protein